MARRSGLTLGEWLNQVIIEGEAPEPDALRRQGRGMEDAEAQAAEEFEPAAGEVAAAREAPPRAAAPPPPQAEPPAPATARVSGDDQEVTRVTQLLEALSTRMEAAEHRSSQAISGIDQSVLGVLSRLDSLGREQSLAKRAIEEVRDAQAKVSERVRRMEHEDNSRVEALRALEAALSRVALQINTGGSAPQGEGQGPAREDVESLGRRLGRVETAVDAAPVAYADGQRTRSELESLGRRVNRVEAASDSAPSLFANAGQTREELDGLVRRVARVEAAADAAPRIFADGEQTRDAVDGLGRRMMRVEAAVEAAPEAYAPAGQTREAFDGVLRRLSRVEGVTQVLPNQFANAGQTREEFETMARRLSRLETTVDILPTAADAAQAREEVALLDRRLGRVEAAAETAPKSYADAEKVETVLSRLAQRLERAELRTTSAIQSLETSFAGLDARLRTAELRPARDGDVPVGLDGGRFQALATELSDKVEATRAEFAERLRGAADGRLDRLEATLTDLAGRVDQAERRSAQAIEHVGREVVGIAQSMGERMAAVETRSASAIEQVGGQLSRMNDAMEQRLQGASSAQAEALERLGGEIARIAERLGERISASERRSAESLDEMGDKLAQITHQMGEHHDRASSELGDRVRQSEERTAKLLEDARQRLGQRASDAPAAAPPAPVIAAADPAPTLFAPAISAPAISSSGPVTSPDPAPAIEPAAEAPPHEPLAEVPEPPAFEADPFEARDADFSDASFDPNDEFEPFEAPLEPHAAEDEQELPEPEPADDPTAFSVRDFAPAAAAGPAQTTREMIEAARAAARRASGVRDPNPVESVLVPPLDPEAKAKPFGITFPGRRKKQAGGPTLRTIFLASGWAAAITTAAVGAHSLMSNHDGSADGGLKSEVAERPEAPTAAGAKPQANLAVALAPAAAGAAQDAPPAATDAKPAAPADAADAGSTATAKRLYADAIKQIEAGSASGVDALRRSANLGYAPAQFYLGRLYEAGSVGLSKDLGAARVWTERAAKSGEPSAMYNLASYYYSGEGGPKDLPAAADWFRRAAQRGVVNSQYNLAQLYENGYGVPQSLTEAYKWYLVAASSGDAEARAKANALKPQLTADAAGATERTATALYAQVIGGSRTATAKPGPDIR